MCSDKLAEDIETLAEDIEILKKYLTVVAWGEYTVPRKEGMERSDFFEDMRAVRDSVRPWWNHLNTRYDQIPESVDARNTMIKGVLKNREIAAKAIKIPERFKCFDETTALGKAVISARQAAIKLGCSRFNYILSAGGDRSCGTLYSTFREAINRLNTFCGGGK